MSTEDFKNKIDELRAMADQKKLNIMDDLEELEKKLHGNGGERDIAWRKVEMARNSDRPTTLDLMHEISEHFIELHGDRHFADDMAMVGGIGVIEGRSITFIGHQKGRNMKENIVRNYGLAHPEGYRKALRLAKQAEKFGRPIITFIDTQGAFPGVPSEERGIGEAIAVNLREFSTLKVPVICFILGEGGSGGALGIAVGDEIFMMENAIYSVITPEGCASILLRDAGKAKEAAAMMKMTAEDLKGFGIIDGIIPEGPGGAQENPQITAENIKTQIIDSLNRLEDKNPKQLIKDRFKKFRGMGQFVDSAERKEGFIKKTFFKS